MICFGDARAHEGGQGAVYIALGCFCSWAGGCLRLGMKEATKEKAACVIDEIDAIGGNRKHCENHTRKTLNQLLV
mgnify:CR=1 FL=1